MSKSIAVIFALMVCALLGMPTAAAQTDTVTASATVDGQDVAAANEGLPLRLNPNHSVDVAVEITNHGTQPVNVRRVELTGRVLDLKFFGYSTMVDATVPAGATDTVRYQLDLSELRGQATGLIRGDLSVIDAAGNHIAVIPTVTDVRGSVFSVFGLFGIGLVVLTALAIIDAAIAISRHRLSTNRWQRGLRLLTPGIGVGLVLGFSSSVARLWVPTTSVWLMIAGGTAAAFFAIGYFSPTPDDEDEFMVLDGEPDEEFTLVDQNEAVDENEDAMDDTIDARHVRQAAQADEEVLA